MVNSLGTWSSPVKLQRKLIARLSTDGDTQRYFVLFVQENFQCNPVLDVTSFDNTAEHLAAPPEQHCCLAAAWQMEVSWGGMDGEATTGPGWVLSSIKLYKIF